MAVPSGSDDTCASDRSRSVVGRRRFVLTSLSFGSAIGLAGCLGGDGGGSSTGGDAARTTTTTAPSETGSGSATTGTAAPNANGSSGDLDLREANVVGVGVERSGDSYTFDVTLHHDDSRESGYANWWQVETLSGQRLGRRELLHAHGSEPFTRSATIEVPGDVSWVVVRGHDETHGYGGQATLVSLPSGETRVLMQGSDPRSAGNETAVGNESASSPGRRSHPFI